jgi:hypothetical protein
VSIFSNVAQWATPIGNFPDAYSFA